MRLSQSRFPFSSQVYRGKAGFFIVMILAFFIATCTGEAAFFIGIVFDLGFLGFSDELLAIFEQLISAGANEIILIVFFAVENVDIADKIARTRYPKQSGALLNGLAKRETFTP